MPISVRLKKTYTEVSRAQNQKKELAILKLAAKINFLAANFFITPLLKKERKNPFY
jgi:hypothetical protein